MEYTWIEQVIQSGVFLLPVKFVIQRRILHGTILAGVSNPSDPANITLYLHMFSGGQYDRTHAFLVRHGANTDRGFDNSGQRQLASFYS